MVPRTEVPLRPGMPISQKGFGLSTGGTLGCFLTDRRSGSTVLVSNQHVLGFYDPRWYADKDGQAEVVQPDGSEINAFVLVQDSWTKIGACYRDLGQPMTSVSSGETIAQHQAKLAEAIARRCTVGRWLRGQLKGKLDAAIATLEPGVQWTNQLRNGVSITAPPAQDQVTVGMKVGKWGARSGCWKSGTITKVGVATTVPFGATSQKTLPMPSNPTPAMHFDAELSDLIEVHGDADGTFQMQGDSGSALCTADGKLIGILSSGGLGRLAYAIPIWTVMQTFDLSFPA